MQTLQQCAHCGFEIGADGHACRPDLQLSPEAIRAARQVAGLELPTRGVYGLPHADSRRERAPASPSRRPSWASDLAAYSTMLVVASLLALGLQKVAGMDRFALQLPDSTAHVLGQIGVGLAVAAGICILLTLAAWAGRAVNRWRRPLPG